MNKGILLTGGLWAALATTALAQTPPKPLDANRDGLLERSEAAVNPALAAQFDRLDRNQDGRLDKSELPPARAQTNSPKQSLDADKDGRISRNEAAADTRMSSGFARLDLNADGFLDSQDRVLAERQRRDAWFRRVDADGNGAISRAEFDAEPGQRTRAAGK